MQPEIFVSIVNIISDYRITAQILFSKAKDFYLHGFWIKHRFNSDMLYCIIISAQKI